MNILPPRDILLIVVILIFGVAAFNAESPVPIYYAFIATGLLFWVAWATRERF